MALFRFGVPFTDRKLRSYLNALRDRPVNFDTPVEQMTVEHGWTVDGSHDEIGTEPQGPPVHDGIFARARQAIINYDFSDPSIVVGHFDPTTPPVGRDMLLELKVLGFRFLCGARVMEVRDDYDGNTTYFGFRYDTLEGHIERGYEWFLLTKDHETGGIHFRIEAHWQLGQFPSLWSKIGFKLIGDLTIRDVTHEVALDVEYAGQAKTPWGTTSAGFSATTKISRKDWNLNWNVALETGGWLVGDQITISIDLELVKQVEQAADAETVAA